MKCFSCKTHSYSPQQAGGDRQLQLRDRVEKYPPKCADDSRVPCTIDEEPTDHALTPPTAKFDRSAATDTIYCPHPAYRILYVFSPNRCVTTEVPPIFRYGWRAAPRWHGRKQTRTAIGLSEVCAHAIPTGAKFTPKPSDTGPVDADERYDICKEDISADTRDARNRADQQFEPKRTPRTFQINTGHWPTIGSFDMAEPLNG
ncbi:hypothetical protein Bca52824_011206 [Brassica carinata]|uniref:Uncharacterized protein n=1 Tax=Brassica carinata TaxID=52824 RepID=A0A8X8BBL1_BRACI|nr:hypothetical protein Bca52824_011206 [Brassica carinata]